MKLSIIVPCLNEASVIAATLQRARGAADIEILVVDGGSNDDTRAVAAPLADQVLLARRGRAHQMNAGAGRATGEVLIFLHAATLVPPDFDTIIRQALADPAVVGGRFDVRLEPSSPLLWLTATLLNLRSRWSRIATGDQTIFVRRPIYEDLGGYAPLPLMEDIDFSRRLKRRGKIACLHAQVVTSSRRWRQRGTVRTILLMWSLRFLYFAGVPAARLARVYDHVR